MKSISDFPRISFGRLPTPLYKLEAASRRFGKDIYIKRDDMTGVALGGNKIRKLEFLLADAKGKGVEVVFTTGGPQSNHAMLTAACAARIGMKAILVLKKQGELSGGNLILDEILGAEVRFVEADDYDVIYEEIDRIAAEYEKKSQKTYLIPMGGSVPLGSLGYVNCAKEMAQQCKDLGICPDVIISATGSGGTYAGITYGAKLFMPETRSIGVGVSDEPFEEITLDLMKGVKELLESDVDPIAEDIHMEYHIGPGYALPDQEGSDAVRWLARNEGILVDPVYTGKALAQFFSMLEKGCFENDKTLIFLHTGGAGGLFAVDLVPEQL